MTLDVDKSGVDCTGFIIFKGERGIKSEDPCPVSIFWITIIFI
jgi:hypothetical protein